MKRKVKILLFMMFDVDDNDDLTGRFGVRNIPTVLFIKNGEVQDKTVGAVTKAQLEEKVKALL